jgi:predicted DsbA family dithiol-disulfide isomerase
MYMRVEIFSDVVCPWCAIGKRRFEAALERFDHQEAVDVHWRAFELDPAAPASSDLDMATHLANKYGISKAQATASQERLTELAAADGLEFHFDRTKRANTFDAHRLLRYAHEVGAQGALKERLFRAYFTDGEAIADRATLVRLGTDVGLDAEKSAEVLESGRYAAEVRADEAVARQLGVTGVPFFVIDRRYGIPGAQSPETILQVLDEAWGQAHPLVVPGDPGDPGELCEDGSCPI